METDSWLHKAVHQLPTNKKQLLAESLLDENVRPDIKDSIERYRHVVASILTEQGMMCVLKGEGAETLADAIQTFTTPHGIRIAAATDKGVNRDHNEDRIAINLIAEFAAVCDGISGGGDGDLAADILAYQLARHPENIQEAVRIAQQEFIDGHLKTNCGTCFASAQIIFEDDGSMFLETKQAGDVHVIIVNADGTLAIESKDESGVDKLVDAGKITPDEALYAAPRGTITNAIYMTKGNVTPTFSKYRLTSGQKILILSDGITDNLTTLEILEIIKGLNGRQMIEKLSDVLQKRMENSNTIIQSTPNLKREKDGQYSDGFLSRPKCDNRAIVVMEVP